MAGTARLGNEPPAFKKIHMIATTLLYFVFARQASVIHVTVDGQDRQALVFQPEGVSGKTPVIFGFHGHMGTMRNASRSFDLQDAWPQALVIYPQGLPTATVNDPPGRFNGWSPDPTENNRDVKFFDALYQKVLTDYQVDTSKVYAMGHSNGGQFMYILWSLRANKFAALGSCEAAGARTVQLTPKPFFVTIGDQDQIVPPKVQYASLNAVFQVEDSSKTGSPFGEKGTLYPGTQPVVLWAYHGTHKFPSDCIPTMIKFFQSCTQ